MKRSIIALVLAVASLSGFAQSGKSEMRFGVTAGLSTAIALKMESNYSFMDQSLGFQMDASPLLSIRPSLIFYSNSRKYENIFSSGPEYTSEKDLYIGGRLDIPLHLIRFSDASIYAGPSFAFISFSSKEWNNAGAVIYQDYENESTILTAGVIIGGQYNPGKHFSIYVESGFEFQSRKSHSRNIDILGDTTSESENAYTDLYVKCPTIGAIVYIK